MDLIRRDDQRMGAPPIYRPCCPWVFPAYPHGPPPSFPRVRPSYPHTPLPCCPRVSPAYPYTPGVRVLSFGYPPPCALTPPGPPSPAPIPPSPPHPPTP